MTKPRLSAEASASQHGQIPPGRRSTSLISILIFSSLLATYSTAVDGSGSIRQSFTFDGNVAAQLQLDLAEASAVKIWINRTWLVDDDQDSCVLSAWGQTTGPFPGFMFPSCSFGSGPVESYAGANGYAASIDPMPLNRSWTNNGQIFSTLDAGVWQFFFMAGSSVGIQDSTYALSMDGDENQVTWLFTNNTGLLTIRDFEGEAVVMTRSVGHGASLISKGSVAIDLGSGFTGFSHYEPPEIGVDSHTFNVTGPDGTEPADELLFFGSAPGTYEFAAEETSLGRWPGQIFIVYSDFSSPSRTWCAPPWDDPEDCS